MACNCNRRQRATTVRNLNQNNFIPSAVEIIYPLTQNVASNAEMLFLQTNYNTGVSFQVRNDNLGVDIIESGVYKITFQGTITSAIEEIVNVAITLNGEPLPQSEISQYVFTAGPQSVTTTIIFKVISPNADIGVINIGENDFDVTNAKLEIVRIGNF